MKKKIREKEQKKNVLSTEYVYMLVPVWGFDAEFSSKKKIYICNFQNG